MDKWLPYIRQILGDDHKRPVVLVGNKTDLTDKSTLDVSACVYNNVVSIVTSTCSHVAMYYLSFIFTRSLIIIKCSVVFSSVAA